MCVCVCCRATGASWVKMRLPVQTVNDWKQSALLLEGWRNELSAVFKFVSGGHV